MRSIRLPLKTDSNAVAPSVKARPGVLFSAALAARTRLLLGGTLLCSIALTAIANGPAQAARAKTGQIRIEYGTPADPAHQAIHERSTKAQVLEYVKALLDSISLPRPLTLRLRSCEGLVNAWYADDAIVVCYEFVAEILKNAPPGEVPAGITAADTVRGTLVDIFLHEAGHAVFDMLKVPLFGREEDAADQFSAYIMLQYDKVQARKLILGAAFQYQSDMQGSDKVLPLKQFADVHGMPAQRFYNLLCIAYGADPRLFADLVAKRYLPKDRADACDLEYRQVSFAFKTLISCHVDRARAQRALKRKFREQ